MEQQRPKAKNILLIIDPQLDFHPGGSLAVNGANEDSERTASMILENINEIDEIYVTLDSHHRNHIAHAIFWENEHGEHPNPFTLITYQNVVDGMWRPRQPTLLQHCISYTKYLESQGKFTLCIWPEHCLIGSTGHAVIPILHYALQEWTAARFRDIHYVMKGQNCLTEMYSAIKADYVIENDSRTQRDPVLLKELQNTERLIVCGQALSHCVNFTFCDILETWPEDKRDKLVLLTDAASPVPGFELSGVDFITKIKAAGCAVATTGGEDNHVLPKKSLPLTWNNTGDEADEEGSNSSSKYTETIADENDYDPLDFRRSFANISKFISTYFVKQQYNQHELS